MFARIMFRQPTPLLRRSLLLREITAFLMESLTFRETVAAYSCTSPPPFYGGVR